MQQEMTCHADKRNYPDVMGFIADLYQGGEKVNYDDYEIAAFCNEECRGVAQVLGDHLMMNVYGEKGDIITFRARHRESGEVLMIAEQESMHTDVLGSLHQPYDLHIGRNTGIVSNENSQGMYRFEVYDMQGRKIDKSQIKNGVYLQIDSGQKNTRKIIKK